MARGLIVPILIMIEELREYLRYLKSIQWQEYLVQEAVRQTVESIENKIEKLTKENVK